MGISNNTKLIALYTDIGRGHPNYMDSTLRAIKSKLGSLPQSFTTTSVFTESEALSSIGWHLVKKIYQHGAQGGLISRFYTILRSPEQNKNQDGIALKILALSLRKKFAGFKGILLVAHPLLVQLLGDICEVYYIHGEIAAPEEFIPFHAKKIFVPIQETAQLMKSYGIPGSRVIVTGLMLEPELVSDLDKINADRLKRIDNKQKPVFGFFNSGAYPKDHVGQIITAVKYVLANNLGDVILSAGSSAKMLKRFNNLLSEYTSTSDINAFNSGKSKILILHDSDRQKLTLKELGILPHTDILIMAAHERVNWSLALGTPSILLKPNIGNYALMNYDFTRRYAPVYSSDKNTIISVINNVIDELTKKSEHIINWNNKFGINGSEYVADYIIKSAKL